MLVQKRFEDLPENGGDFSGHVLMLTQQVKELEEKLEASYRQQHHLENQLEEYEVNLKRSEEALKTHNKRFHEL